MDINNTVLRTDGVIYTPMTYRQSTSTHSARRLTSVGRTSVPVVDRELDNGTSAPPVPSRIHKTYTTQGGVHTKAPARLPSSDTSLPPPVPARSPLLQHLAPDTHPNVHLATRPPPPSQLVTALNDPMKVISTSSPRGSDNHTNVELPLSDHGQVSDFDGGMKSITKQGDLSPLVQALRGRLSKTSSKELKLSPEKFVTTATTSSPSSTSSSQIVSLTHWPIPRRTLGLSSDGEMPVPSSISRTRRGNEYVDSPSHIGVSTSRMTSHRSEEDGLPELFQPDGPGVNLRDCHHDPALPFDVTTRSGMKQSPMHLVKRTEKASSTLPAAAAALCKEGIVCSRCGKCRCANCAEPRELPRRWVGNHECSAGAVIDSCTCLCCVKALFYHARRSDDEDYSDDPCACCERPACCGRWATIALLACTCLPCLLCYWPMRCAVGACASCYNSRRIIGCRCKHITQPTASGMKGLLTPESESSSY